MKFYYCLFTHTSYSLFQNSVSLCFLPFCFKNVFYFLSGQIIFLLTLYSQLKCSLCQGVKLASIFFTFLSVLLYVSFLYIQFLLLLELCNHFISFFKFCSASQHTVHHKFLMQCSTIYQLRITPSPRHITCPP